MASSMLPSSPPPAPLSSSSQYLQDHASSASTSSSTTYNTPLPSLPTLTTHLSSSHDPTRKMAVFKLQSAVGDPGFADAFIQEGGLPKLRLLVLEAHGNTLAYALNAWARLLELDRGWEEVDTGVVARVVELVVTHPLVNILRGAMSILVAVVSHPVNSSRASQMSHSQRRQYSSKGPEHDTTPTTPSAGPGQVRFGLRALKPALQMYPQFLEILVERLSSADHALCANSLMLISSLMRDAITTTSSSSKDYGSAAKKTVTDVAEAEDAEWPKFIKRMQDLGVIKAVYVLMQSTALLQDLGHPLLEFQSLTKVLLRRWRDVKVDLNKPEHLRALKSLQAVAVNAGIGDPGAEDARNGNGISGEDGKTEDGNSKSTQEEKPERWRRLGFRTESPVPDFERTGYLGLLDLTDYARKQQDGFVKLLLEQAAQPPKKRCPIARASIAVTLMLYSHFDIDQSVNGAMTNHTGEIHSTPYRNPSSSNKSKRGRRPTRSNSKHDTTYDDSRTYPKSEIYMPLESRTNYDRAFKPLLLQWSRLHTAGLKAFLRLWKATGAAEEADFEKVEELVRILIESVVGQAVRTTDIAQVEEEIAEADPERLRALQMEIRDLAYDDAWGKYLRQVREELHHEALQFVKEQRIRCLLQGAWFPQLGYAGEQSGGPVTQESLDREVATSWKYVKLSHNRRYVHFAIFKENTETPPGLERLEEKVDLSTVTSVVSNVSAAAAAASEAAPLSPSSRKTSLLLPKERQLQKEQRQIALATTPKSQTKITIHGIVHQPPSSSGSISAAANAKTSRSHQGHNNNNSISNNNNNNNNGTITTTTTSSSNIKSRSNTSREAPLLTLNPQSQSLASEWLDGLLMLLNQQPITADTNKLVELISGYGLKIRLLNVRLVDDADDDDDVVDDDVVDDVVGYEHDDLNGNYADDGEKVEKVEGKVEGKKKRKEKKKQKQKQKSSVRTGMAVMMAVKEPVLPSREGLDEDYYYDIGAM